MGTVVEVMSEEDQEENHPSPLKMEGTKDSWVPRTRKET